MAEKTGTYIATGYTFNTDINRTFQQSTCIYVSWIQLPDLYRAKQHYEIIRFTSLSQCHKQCCLLTKQKRLNTLQVLYITVLLIVHCTTKKKALIFLTTGATVNVADGPNEESVVTRQTRHATQQKRYVLYVD